MVRRGGDDLPSLKADRPATHDDVARFLADPPPGLIQSTHKAAHAGHGRIEERRHAVRREVSSTRSDRR